MSDGGNVPGIPLDHEGLSPFECDMLERIWALIMSDPPLEPQFPISARLAHALIGSPLDFGEWWDRFGADPEYFGEDYIRGRTCEGEGGEDDYLVNLPTFTGLVTGDQGLPLTDRLGRRVSRAVAQWANDQGLGIEEMKARSDQWNRETGEIRRLFRNTELAAVIEGPNPESESDR